MNSLKMNHPKFNRPITLYQSYDGVWNVLFDYPDGFYDCEIGNLDEAYNEAIAVSLVMSHAEYNTTYTVG